MGKIQCVAQDSSKCVPTFKRAHFTTAGKWTLVLPPIWYLPKHLELSGSYQLTRIRFPSRNDTFLAHLGRLRIGSALNAKFSANVFIQLNSIRHVVSGNIRVRYNFREGNDLWVVYNQNVDTDRNRVLPRLSAMEGHTALVKYTHTFRY